MGMVKNPEGSPYELRESILGSVQKMRPEAWNPRWKMSEIENGVYQLWLGAEKTYSAMYYNEYGDEAALSISEKRMDLAMKSRVAVLSHPKFNSIFGKYAQELKIHQDQEFDRWAPLFDKIDELEIRKAEKENREPVLIKRKEREHVEPHHYGRKSKYGNHDNQLR